MTVPAKITGEAYIERAGICNKRTIGYVGKYTGKNPKKLVLLREKNVNNLLTNCDEKCSNAIDSMAKCTLQKYYLFAGDKPLK